VSAAAGAGRAAGEGRPTGAGRGRRDAAPAPRHLYVHVPFCAERCDYCEFYSVAVGRDERGRLLDRYLAALLVEWERERERFGVRRLETVFVGGGTPSVLGQDRLERLVELLEPLLTPRAEITIETNPEDVSPAYAAWAAARRLRVSLGVQSFDASLRAALGRSASADPAAAFALLREAGVGDAGPDPNGAHRPGANRPGANRPGANRPGANRPGTNRPARPSVERRPGAPGLGVDLIFGVPGQGEAHIEAELATLARLGPDHVSWYELGVVPGTVLAARVALTDAGRMGWDAPELPDEETVARMYRQVVTGLGRLGYEWYEVSNFARPGRRCCHNGAVWRGRDYLGIGPGAVGTVAGVRRRDLPDVEAYLDALESGADPPRELETLDAATRARERLLLATRTGGRVPLAELAGVIDEDALPALAHAGLVSLAGGTLRVTRKGRYVASGVCVRLFRDSSFLEA